MELSFLLCLHFFYPPGALDTSRFNCICRANAFRYALVDASTEDPWLKHTITASSTIHCIRQYSPYSRHQNDVTFDKF